MVGIVTRYLMSPVSKPQTLFAAPVTSVAGGILLQNSVFCRIRFGPGMFGPLRISPPIALAGYFLSF